MIDEKEKGIRHFNSCYHASLKRDHVIRTPITNGEIVNADLPGAIIDGYSNVTVGSRAFTDITCGYVIENGMKPLLQHRTGPDNAELMAARLEELLPLFGDSRLPSNMKIRRDPFDTDFSVFYTIVDLLDLKKGITGLAKRMFSARRSNLPRKLTARQLHDTHLGVRFGIIPTIADIQDLISTISSWKKRYDQIGALSEKRWTVHDHKDQLQNLVVGFDLEDWEESHVGTIPVFPNGGALGFNIRSSTVASWHAEALYGFTCPEFQGWLSRLAQITDSFGLLDPAALWDVVPFSFIVDWFFSVSSWLHKNRPRLFPATAVLYDYLESVKIEQTVRYTLTAGYLEVASPYYRVSTDLIGTEVYTTYHRQRFQPPDGHVTLAPGTRENVSFVAVANRVAIASSLVAQRLPR
jgi:hypothetical protein